MTAVDNTETASRAPSNGADDEALDEPEGSEPLDWRETDWALPSSSADPTEFSVWLTKSGELAIAWKSVSRWLSRAEKAPSNTENRAADAETLFKTAGPSSRCAGDRGSWLGCCGVEIEGLVPSERMAFDIGVVISLASLS